MRKETKKYICAELRNYYHSQRELKNIDRELAEMARYPAYLSGYTEERMAYVMSRRSNLVKLCNAIALASQDFDEVELQIIRLKFWSPKPRPTDIEIAGKLCISPATYYRSLREIYRKVGARLGTDL